MLLSEITNIKLTHHPIMDEYRKLLVLAVNELLKRKLISLDGDREERGHITARIAGEDSVILWQSSSVWNLHQAGRKGVFELSF